MKNQTSYTQTRWWNILTAALNMLGAGSWIAIGVVFDSVPWLLWFSLALFNTVVAWGNLDLLFDKAGE